MAATVTIRVNTGVAAGTESGAVSGIDLVSDDNAINSPANRTTYPVSADSDSYEKWLTARVDVAPDNECKNLKWWGDGAIQSSTDLYIGKTAAGVTPTNNVSTVATNDFTQNTATSKFDWHSTAMTGIGSTSDFGVFQLSVDADASPGNWLQETLNYSYDEL